MSDVTKLGRAIAVGEEFRHTGLIEVDGIGAGALVVIMDGGLRVTGDVADDADISVHGKSENFFNQTNSVSGVFRNVTITSGRIVSGDLVGGHHRDKSTDPLNGCIDVLGYIGNRVTLDADVNVHLANDAGHKLTVKAGANVRLQNTGDMMLGNAGAGFVLEYCGKNSEFRGGASAQAKGIGAGSSAEGGANCKVGIAEAGSSVSGGASAHVERAGKGVKVRGGATATVDHAHETASVKGGAMANVKKRYSTEESFVIPRADDKSATGTAQGRKPAV